MKILRTCADPSCSILAMGMFCIAHDAKEPRVFPRGRPFFREPAVVRAPKAPIRSLDRRVGTSSAV